MLLRSHLVPVVGMLSLGMGSAEPPVTWGGTSRAWKDPGPQIIPKASATGQETPLSMLGWSGPHLDLLHSQPHFGLGGPASILPAPGLFLGEETVFAESLLCAWAVGLGIWQAEELKRRG